MVMAITIHRQVHREIHTLSPVESPERSNSSASSHAVSAPRVLRPCQKAYYGAAFRTVDSVARRLFKRSAHCIKDPSQEAIFAEHAANMKGTDLSGRPSQGSFAGAALRAATPAGFHVAIIAGADLQREESRLAEERKILITSINSARHLQGSPPVILDADLTERLQSYAGMLEDLELFTPNPKPVSAITPPTSISHNELFTAANHGVRLVSPPSMGALAVGEMWYAGKYKQHENGSHVQRAQSLVNHSHLPASIVKRLTASAPSLQLGAAQSSSLEDSSEFSEDSTAASPVSEASRIDSVMADAVKRPTHSHLPPNCACHLYKVYTVIVDPKWKMVGIGRSGDGRWVVEFADMVVERTAFETERG